MNISPMRSLMKGLGVEESALFKCPLKKRAAMIRKIRLIMADMRSREHLPNRYVFALVPEGIMIKRVEDDPNDRRYDR